MSDENAAAGRCYNGLGADAIMRSWANGFRVGKNEAGTCDCKKFTKRK